MKTLAAPIASTTITAAKRTSSCKDVIASAVDQTGTGSDDAATLSVASESMNIAMSESFSI